MSVGNIVVIRASSLIKPKHPTKSCGCYRIEQIHRKKTIHWQSGSRYCGNRTQLYRCWSNIKTRCYNEKVRSYADYGAKGIKMCDELENDFVAFYRWAIENGFKDGLTINRIDSKKDYCAENCEWVTLEENSRQCRKIVHCWGKDLQTNMYYEFDNIREFSRNHNLSFSAIDQVLHKHNKTLKGWIFGYID